jgi:hypothetical protein
MGRHKKVQGGVHISTVVSEDVMEKAKELGKGNASDGIRKMLDTTDNTIIEESTRELREGKVDFLLKCQRHYKMISMLNPEKIPTYMLAWLTGPANAPDVMRIWGNTKKAYQEIAIAVGDDSWVPR